MIIFVRTKHATEELAERLELAGAPYSFEDDGSLVIPVAWEAAVEEILEAVEYPDALDADDDDEGAPTRPTADEDDDLHDDGADGAESVAHRSASGEVLSELHEDDATRLRVRLPDPEVNRYVDFLA